MNKKLFNLIEKFQDSKSILNVLSNAKIANGHIYVTDLISSIKAKIDHKGQGLVSVTELKKIFQRNDIDSIEIDDKSALIKCGKKSFTLNSDNIEDFPDTEQDFIFMCNLTIDKEFLRMKDFLGKGDLKPSMQGIHWNKARKEFAATDANRMKWIPAPPTVKDLVIPPKVFLLPEGEYEVFIGDHHIKFSNNDFDATFRLTDSLFPKYEAIIPENNTNILTLDKKEFVECLNDALICANPITNMGVINSGGVLTSQDLDENKSFRVDMSHKFEGEDITIGFNIKLLLDCLKSIDSDSIELAMSTPNRAITINGNTLIMPVVLNY